MKSEQKKKGDLGWSPVTCHHPVSPVATRLHTTIFLGSLHVQLNCLDIIKRNGCQPIFFKKKLARGGRSVNGGGNRAGSGFVKADCFGIVKQGGHNGYAVHCGEGEESGTGSFERVQVVFPGDIPKEQAGGVEAEVGGPAEFAVYSFFVEGFVGQPPFCSVACSAGDVVEADEPGALCVPVPGLLCGRVSWSGELLLIEECHLSHPLCALGGPV
jgi:hypothetical protein